MHSQWVCTVKMGGIVGLLEVRKALQRDGMRFSKTKCQALHLATTTSCSTSGWDRVAGKLPGEKGCGGAGQQWLDMNQQFAQVAEKNFLYQKFCVQQDQGSDSSPVLGIREATL